MYKIQANASGTRSINVSDEHLATIRKYSLLKIRSNSIFLRASLTVFMYSVTRQNLLTNARIFITLEMKAAFDGMIRRLE